MLTAAQKAKVRTYLGWSAQYAQTDHALEGAFDGLATQPEHEALVIALIADIDGIKTKLLDSHKRLKAVKVGSIELDGMRTEIAGLRWEGARLTGEMSAIMGVERKHNIFSSGSGRTNWFYGPIGDRNGF
jgi:hypothetical protein